MIGIKTTFTTDWQLYPDPLLLKNYDGREFAHTDEKTPYGHNCVKIVGRDMLLEYINKVYASHNYRFEFVGKCLQGSRPVGGGLWGGEKSPQGLTNYARRFVLIKELGNGWGVYRKEAYPREDCNARLYFQLEQGTSNIENNTHWLIGDIHVRDLTATGGGGNS